MRKLKLLLVLCLVAIAASASKTVYLAPGPWDVDGAKYAIWAWPDGGDGQWYIMTDENSDGIYEYTFTDDNITGMQFGRMSSTTLTSATDYNTAEKWNTTGNQSVTDGLLYTISGEIGSPTVTQSIFGATAASFTNGSKYLFKNVGSNRYLGPGTSWGTRASLLEQSHYNTLQTISEGVYKIESQVSNGDGKIFLGLNNSSEMYMDNAGNNISIIRLSTGKFVMSFADETTYIGYDGTNKYAVHDLTDHNSNNAQWILIAYDEALTGATEENPIDATYRILDQNFDRGNRYTNAWTMDAGNKNLCGGRDANKVAESWRSAFTLSQNVAVPNGIYKIRAQAAVTEYDVTGADLPVVYATSSNEKTVPFNICEKGYDTMEQFSDDFTSGGFFTEWSDKVLVTNGQITVGVKGTRTNTWCVWDNIQLIYYGVDLTALRNAYSEALATAQAYEGNLFDEDWATLNAVITANTLDLNGSLTENQLNTATANLEAANEVAAAAAVKYSTYTSANTLINGGENVNLTSLIENPSFENNFTGWTNTGSMAIQGNTSFGKDGSSYAEYWQPNGTKGLSQTVGVLPSGVYRLTVHVKARGVTSARVFAAGINVPVMIEDAENDYIVNFALDDKTDALIGFEGVGTGAGNSWLALDNFRLTYVGELPNELTAVEGKMNADVAADQTAAIAAYDALKTAANYNAAEVAIAAAQASVNAYLPLGAVITKIDAALTAATSATESDADYQAIKTAYNNGTIDDADIPGQIRAAYNAVIPVIKSQTAASADFTLAIQNPSFEYGDMTGWTVGASNDTGARETSNPTYAATGSDGKYLFNTWSQGIPLTQEVAGLPNGKYTLTASVASDGATIYLIANSEHNEGTETGGTYPSKDVMQEATFTFLVTDGTATIGVVGGADGTAGEHKDYVEEGYWWYKADNFRLVKNRDLNPVYAVVGSNWAETDKAIFSGIWDQATTTDILTESAGSYTKTYSNVTLDRDSIAFKVIKKADLEATTSIAETSEYWYPASNVKTVIPVKGKYNITITFNGNEESPVVTGEATKVSEAVAVGPKGWATHMTASHLDFSAVDGINAYTAKLSGTNVTLTDQDNVPSETPIVVKATEGTYYVPVLADAPAAVDNDLQWNPKYVVNDAYRYIFGLYVGGDGKACFKRVNDKQTMGEKAFLEVDPALFATPARELTIVFDDETTGIQNLTPVFTEGDGAVYDLQGRKVAQPTKGLYIVNGKKVVKK